MEQEKNNWVDKARRDLKAISASKSHDSYIQANYKNGKKKSKHVAYSIPDEAKQCIEYLSKLIDDEDIKEYEAEIKGFLLPFRTFRRGEIEKGFELI